MALLIVDVQNDFIDGSLALKTAAAKQDGYEVVPIINQLLRSHRFAAIVYSQDWHPRDHCSFIGNVAEQTFHPDSKVKKENAKVFDTVLLDGNQPHEQMLFPAHCIQGTPGAGFHPELTVVNSGDVPVFIVQKGTFAYLECYSAFRDNQKKIKTQLESFLRKHDITDILVCGLAMDFCVGFTALDGLELGYGTAVIEDATRGCDESGMKRMRQMILEKGGVFLKSSEIGNLLSGKLRMPEFAMQKLKAKARS